MTLTDLINIMFRASQAEHGLLLRVSDPKRAMGAFFRAREAHPDAELPPVRFRELLGHPEGNLVILRGGQHDEGRGGVKLPSDKEDLF